jgi:hypothetical protein
MIVARGFGHVLLSEADEDLEFVGAAPANSNGLLAIKGRNRIAPALR